jgi:formimidoylglutamase
MGIERLKDILQPVPDELLEINSHDNHDHWLIQEVAFDERDYFKATHVLIGCPQHEGVRRNKGRIGAEKAPNAIREQLYKLQVNKDSHIKLFDAGNVNTDYFDYSGEMDLNVTGEKYDALDKIHDSLTKAVSKFLQDGKKVIVLGGGNDISYADIRALSEAERELSAINIDAHLDMRIADEMTSGTPYRKAIEDGYLAPEHFYEFGIRPQSNAEFYLENAEKLGVQIWNLKQIMDNGVVNSFRKIMNKINDRPFFLGLDMDSIQASDAPGVSASSPIGLSGREVMLLIQIAGQHENLKLFEITEVNPKYDVDDRTVKLASQLVYEFLFG